MSTQENITKTKNGPETLYDINFNKLETGIKEKWFGSTHTKFGKTPNEIYINENEPLHLVQILYTIKEHSWEDNKWYAFTKQNIIDMIKKDEKYYIENTILFGDNFFDQFQLQINVFLENYCNEVGYY